MTTELEPIEGTVLAECPDCDCRLMIDFQSDQKPIPLGHNDDGSHTIPAVDFLGPDSDDGSDFHTEEPT